MGIGTNPIYLLGRKVIDGSLEIEQALRKVATGDFSRKGTKEYGEQIIEFIDSGMSKTMADALIFSRLNQLWAETVRNDRLFLSKCKESHGKVLFNNQHFQDAIISLNAARTMYRKIGLEERAADCKICMADAYSGLKQNDRARKLIKSARKDYTNLGLQISAAECDVKIANASLADDRKLEIARIYYRSAKDIFEANNMPLKVAACNIDIANVYTGMYQYEYALEFLQAARKIYDDNDSHAGVAECDKKMGEIHVLNGKLNLGRELYESAREIYETKQMHSEVVECLRGIAYSYTLAYEYDKSFEYLSLAKTICEAHNMLINLADCNLSAAGCFIRLDQDNKAREWCLRALRIYEQEHKPIGVAECYKVIAACAEPEKALDWLSKARKLYAENGETDRCDHDLAIAYALLDRHDEALELFQSMRKKRSRKDPHWLDVQVCDLNIAKIYRNKGQYKTSLKLFRKLLRKTDDLEIKWESLYWIGLILSDEGRYREAEKAYKQALAIIEDIRKSIKLDKVRTFFLEKTEDVYSSLIDIYLAQNNCESAIEYVERLKSRNLATLIAQRASVPEQLDDGANSEIGESSAAYRTESDANITYLEITSLVSKGDCALIELYPMLEKTIALVVLNSGGVERSELITSDYDLPVFTEQVQELRQRHYSYKAGQSSRQHWEEHLDLILKELYDRLFSKIKPYLEGIRKIIMIPYSGFHLLPLHAMYAEENGHRRYVIDDYQVTYAPSAKILKACVEQNGTGNGKVLLANANPKGTTPLGFAEEEIETIRSLFPEASVMNKATKSTLKSDGNDAFIWHYAGHADSNALILHHDELRDEKEKCDLYYIAENFDLSNTYLATLSACETGVTELQAGVDEFVGLPSGFLCAGAATVISSLWSVSDISTFLLMTKMYQLIKMGKGKAESLRLSQLWLKDPQNRAEHEQMSLQLN